MHMCQHWMKTYDGLEINCLIEGCNYMHDGFPYAVNMQLGNYVSN